MTDIVEQLRQALKDYLDPCKHDMVSLVEDAADEIVRLRKDVQNLNRDCMSLAGDNERLSSQLNRHEWAESADRALMEEEIEHLRGEVKSLSLGD